MAPKRRTSSQSGHGKDKRQRKATSQTQNRDQASTSPEKNWQQVDNCGNKVLECTICQGKFRMPQMLPCGHCFCKDDLICLAPLGTETISCPQCREQFPVPNGDTTQFPINFHLKELVDEQLMLQRMTGGGEVKFSCTCCDVGNQSEVVAKCQECGHYLCTTGLAKHKHYERWRQHNVCVLEKTPLIYMVLRSRPITTSHEYKYERNADDWAIFDALYDEEHSIHLIRYWMQFFDLQQSQPPINKRKKYKSKANKQYVSNHGNSKWQEAMVNHYLMCLDNLEESGLIDRDSLAKKQQEVAIFFKQAGQYSKAIELIEKTLDMERKDLGERPENMAQLFSQAGSIYNEILNCQLRGETGLIQKQMEYARLSLTVRKTMKGDDNKFELARVLRLLSAALYRWWRRGDDSVLSAADARTEGKKCIDESIEIFKRLNAKGNVAKSTMNKSNLEELGSKIQEKLLREALAMCEETYGKYSVVSGHIHRNMSLLYQKRSDNHETYNWLIKSREIYEKVFGRHHPKTEMVYDELESLRSEMS